MEYDCNICAGTPVQDMCICGHNRAEHNGGSGCPWFDSDEQYMTGNFEPLPDEALNA